MELELDEMTGDNVAACAPVFMAAFTRPPWNEDWNLQEAEEVIRGMVSEPTFWGIVVYLESELVGFLCGRVNDDGAEQSFFCVELCVHPNYQGHGIGSALLEAAQYELLKRHVTSMEIGTDKNTPAEAFYRKHGFAETASTKTEIYMKWQFGGIAGGVI